jgi:PIN domain nuclease of toxin-antitoxin system
MRLLLDTHVALAVLQDALEAEHPEIARIVNAPSTASFFSVASLWEIAIKSRLGKLHPGMELEDIPEYLEAVGIVILPIHVAHVTAAVEPQPRTRDPFDRLLLAQCKAEDLKLVTVDGAMAKHPLALGI